MWVLFLEQPLSETQSEPKAIANKTGECLRSPPSKPEKFFWQPRELQGATKRYFLPPQNCAPFPANGTLRELAVFCAALGSGWPINLGLQHCSSSPGAFPTDSFTYYFTPLLSRVRSLEEELQYSMEVLPFFSVSSKKQFPWIVSSSWALQLQSHCRAASSTRTEAHTLNLISRLSVWGLAVLYLCCPCTQAWNQASTPAHLDVFCSYGWEQLGRIFSAFLWGFFPHKRVFTSTNSLALSSHYLTPVTA